MLAFGAVMAYGWRQTFIGQREKLELGREKIWARLHLIPLLQAEEDRDQVRRHYADLAREQELLGSQSTPYNSDRYVQLSSLGLYHGWHREEVLGRVLRWAKGVEGRSSSEQEERAEREGVYYSCKLEQTAGAANFFETHTADHSFLPTDSSDRHTHRLPGGAHDETKNIKKHRSLPCVRTIFEGIQLGPKFVVGFQINPSEPVFLIEAPTM
jgi:hypothetical protein